MEKIKLTKPKLEDARDAFVAWVDQGTVDNKVDYQLIEYHRAVLQVLNGQLEIMGRK